MFASLTVSAAGLEPSFWPAQTDLVVAFEVPVPQLQPAEAVVVASLVAEESAAGYQRLKR